MENINQPEENKKNSSGSVSEWHDSNQQPHFSSENKNES